MLGTKASLGIAKVASLIGEIGQVELPRALDDLLMGLAPFDLSAIFGFPYDTRPLVLHNGYRSHASEAALEAYLNGAYLLDPFYTASVQEHPAGLWRMRDVAPDSFFDSEFYSSKEVHPCISLQPGSLVEEIGYLIPLRVGLTAVYSLMRSQGAPFSQSELASLAEVEPLVREIVRSHWRNLDGPPKTVSINDVMEAAFTQFSHDKLTYQQRRIVRLVLRGHSNHSISQQLCLAEGTVKLHRQNIYKRLDISSQRELFAMFVQDSLGIGLAREVD